MENSICLDTDIIAGLLRNKPEVVRWFKDNTDKELVTTSVSLFELYHGAYKSNSSEKNLAAIDKLINRIKIIDFSRKAALEAGKQYARLEKEGNIIEFRDMFIGCIALVEGFSLKTNNKSHFSRIEGLKIL